MSKKGKKAQRGNPPGANQGRASTTATLPKGGGGSAVATQKQQVQERGSNVPLPINTAPEAGTAKTTVFKDLKDLQKVLPTTTEKTKKPIPVGMASENNATYECKGLITAATRNGFILHSGQRRVFLPNTGVPANQLVKVGDRLNFNEAATNEFGPKVANYEITRKGEGFTDTMELLSRETGLYTVKTHTEEQLTTLIAGTPGSAVERLQKLFGNDVLVQFEVGSTMFFAAIHSNNNAQ